MDVLIRIKRLVVARRVEFTVKAEEERLRDSLSVEDVLESVVNANAIKKPNSPPDPHPRSGPCPTCGSRRVVHVQEDVAIRVGRRTHRFERVHHERCASCGERIFYLVTSQQFDAAILKGRRRAA